MAVVHTRGEPDRVMPLILPALYGSVYKLKSNLKKVDKAFEIAPLRARWPDAHLLPRFQWHAIWAIPVPEETTTLPQKLPHIAVELELWDYGTVAQVLHIGPYSDEGPAVQRLKSFIEESGYEIAGPHEEEYLTSPTAKVQKTIIRYQVAKKEAFLSPAVDYSPVLTAG
jgi:hypothetical protein